MYCRLANFSALYTVLCLIAGCTSIAPGTVLALKQVDPLSADPADIAVTLDLPPGLGVLPGSVLLSLSASRSDGETLQGVWPLESTRDPLDRWVFAFAERDFTDIRALQRKARAWEDADPTGTTGSLSVGLGGCRTVPAALLENTRASVSIRLEENGPFRPLFKNAPISEVFSDQDLSALPRCP